MKNKGFTLIELLAVIVILAIIALIATPIILGIINDAKRQSDMRSAELYLSSVELAVARKNLTTPLGNAKCAIQGSGNLVCRSSCELVDSLYECTETLVEVSVDNTVPVSGTIVIENGKITQVKDLYISDKYYSLNSNNNLHLSLLCRIVQIKKLILQEKRLAFNTAVDLPLR